MSDGCFLESLGCTKTKQGFYFGLYSENAEKVELCVFDPKGERELRRYETQRSGNVHHVELGPEYENFCYGYRVHGPWDPASGKKFNPNKLLLDPYAKNIRGALRDHMAIFGYIPDNNNPRQEHTFNPVDSAPFVPKGVIGKDPRPLNVGKAVASRFEVVYEVHLQGFTRSFPNIPDRVRGTYAGMISKEVLGYLKDLGVTAILFKPLQYLSNSLCPDCGGQGILSFFAPHPDQVLEHPVEEIKSMTACLSANGIRPIMETAPLYCGEGDPLGPHWSLRGIDNEVYYTSSGERSVGQTNGRCANRLNFGHPMVRRLCRDGLIYWKNVCGLQGFRFESGSETSDHADYRDFLANLRADPEFSDISMLTESPLPEFTEKSSVIPEVFLEFSDASDSLEKFWLEGDVMLQGFADFFAGSQTSETLPKKGFGSKLNGFGRRKGFSLRDRIAEHSTSTKVRREEEEKSFESVFRNLGNPDSHKEGLDENFSTELRRVEIAKAMLASLIFAGGNPFLSAGDEIGHTLNNSGQTLPDEQEWNFPDWNTPYHWKKGLGEVSRKAVEMRKEIQQDYPRSFEETGKLWKWYFSNGSEVERKFGFQNLEKTVALKMRSSDPRNRHPRYLCFNAGEQGCEFAPPQGHRWGRLLFSTRGEFAPESGNSAKPIVIPPLSLSLFTLQSETLG